ncbi:MAG: cysteine desulfurase-like protein [Acidobacteriota bacterium]
MSTPLDPEFARAFFPALAGDWVFFDNAGGSQILRPVLDRINDYLVASNVQHGASYALSELASERLRIATEAVAMLMNAEDAAEIVMGPSSSLLLHMLADALGRQLAPGDEIIVTNADHEANIGPWLDVQRLGVSVKFWTVRPESRELHPEDLVSLLGPRTRLVALTHTSNILGRIQPIRAIADLAHERGAMLCVDGVAYAPHRAIDVRALDVDFYVFSFYKVYGPHHAVLYGKREHLLGLPSLNHYFVDQTDIPYKLQPGGVNYELSYGMLGLVDYLRQLAAAGGCTTKSDREAVVAAFDAIGAHEQLLARRLLEFLASKSGVCVVGPDCADRDVRVPTVSFRVPGVSSRAIVSSVDAHKIGIRWGDFYSPRLIDDLGLRAGDGVVRVSMVHYNTLHEVDRLIGVLEPLI